MTSYTLQELAEAVGGRIIGDPQAQITHAAPIEAADPKAISFLANPKYARHLENTKAGAVIVGPQINQAPVTLLQVENPYAAFALLLYRLHPTPRPRPGVHPSAVVGAGASLGEGVYIGPNAVIGENALIGDHTYIHAGVVIGPDCRLGGHCTLWSNVTVYHGVTMGDKVVIHSGTVVGSDGFGYVFAAGKQQKVPQVGTVIIEDEAEIGANVTIDRGTLGPTLIGRCSKIDNLVQIAHNVVVGENSIVVAQTGISGSTKLGKRVVLGGQVGTVGHITLGDDTKVAARGGVTKSTEPGTILAGFSGQPHAQWRKSEAAVRRLPQLMEKMRLLEKQLAELSKKT